MARLRFIAPGHTGHTCKVFGQAFAHGEWVEAKGLSPTQLETLAANPTFEAELDAAPRKGAKSGTAGTDAQGAAGEA